jgi:hypothetical protein
MAIPDALPGAYLRPQFTNGNLLHQSSAGDFYIVGEQAIGVLGCWKSTNPGTASWVEQDTTNRPAPTHTGSFSAVACARIGDVIVVLWRDWTDGSNDMFVSRFDMASDTWEDTATGSKSRIVDNAITAPTWAGCDVAIRADGTAVGVYGGAREKIMGTDYRRPEYCHGPTSGVGVWTNSVLIVAGSPERQHVGANVAIGDADAAHVVWHDQGDVRQRAFNSSHVAQTNRDTTFNNGFGAIDNWGQRGVSLVRGGTLKLRFPYKSDTGDAEVLSFDAAADPSTFASNVISTDDVDGPNNAGPEVLLVPDGDQLRVVFVKAADNDVYHDEDGSADSFGTDTLHRTSTATHLIGAVVSHRNGGDKTISLAYHDGTNNVYDEIAITDTYSALSAVDVPDQKSFLGPFEV